MYEHRFLLEGPRWAGISSYIKDECHQAGLICCLDVEKGWVTEKVRGTIKGEREMVEAFMLELDCAIIQYNRD